jgi:hypothetical protein
MVEIAWVPDQVKLIGLMMIKKYRWKSTSLMRIETFFGGKPSQDSREVLPLFDGELVGSSHSLEHSQLGAAPVLLWSAVCRIPHI